MASDQSQVDFVVDQLREAGSITAKKMFGEYGIYCDGKIVGLFCDNQLFVKPTDAGRARAGDVPEAPPYPGSKPYLLVQERLEDREWLVDLIRTTADALPVPKPKAKKTPRRESK